MTVGVFDSGVGGLSVLVPLIERIPHADFLYAADQAWCPYGPLPPHQIRARSLAMAQALIHRGASLIVVACNSASSAALADLRTRLPSIPFVGMEPAVKPAAARTKSGHVGVLATAATAEGERLATLIDRFGHGVHIHVHVPEGLVQLIESGAGESEEAAELLAPVCAAWRVAGVDVVVLGCTHYPFARRTLERLLGPDVEVIDPAPAVARQAARVYGERFPSAGEQRGDRERVLTFLTTGDPTQLRETITHLAGGTLLDGARFEALRMNDDDAARLRSA